MGTYRERRYIVGIRFTCGIQLLSCHNDRHPKVWLHDTRSDKLIFDELET